MSFSLINKQLEVLMIQLINEEKYIMEYKLTMKQMKVLIKLLLVV